ncbi:YjbH domain-containing protein [Aliidiomarina sanyensis]|nr:YjbH domain-containing protein [Aliidiomarina sanyensis]
MRLNAITLGILFAPIFSLAGTALALESDASQSGTNVNGQYRQPANIADDVTPIPRAKQITLELQASLRLDAFLDFALAQFAAQGQPLEDVYWPNARLVFNDRAAQAEAARSRVLADLDAIARTQPEIAAPLARQIQQWQLGAQPYGELSLERARLRNDSNPLIPAGSYTLYLPTRGKHIAVYGLVESAGLMPFEAGQSVRGYLASLQQQNLLLDGADRDHATLVRNTEVRSHVPWGPHNATQVELQPGDMVWLGPREASAYGIMPVGVLGHALHREARKAAPNFDENLASLLSYFVYDRSGAQVQTQRTDSAGYADRLRRATQRYSASGSWQSEQMDSAAGAYSDTRRRVTTGNYGQAGLIQMPTARMGEPGELTLSYNDMDIYRRYTVNLQLFDWLETSAFYVRVPNRLYSNVPSFSGDQILTDKGFDVKVRLWEESYYLPEVAVGLRDFAGTGLFDGEFIVANKAWGPLDFTLGVGFGRLGTRDQFKNPLCHAADRFCDRPTATSGRGGQFEYGRWFRGPTAMFGGVEYQTPWQPLRLKLEYESNDYSTDRAGIDIEPRTPWNFGLNYQLNNAIDLRLGYERGDTLSFGFTLRTNFNQLQQVKINPTPVAPQEPKVTTIEEVNWPAVRRQLRQHFTYSGTHFYAYEEGNQPTSSDTNGSQRTALGALGDTTAGSQRTALGAQTDTTAGTPDTVALYTYPWRQREPREKLDRTARILAAELPEHITRLEITEQVYNRPLATFELDLSEYRRQLNYEDPDVNPQDAWQGFTRVEPGPRPDIDSEGWQETYSPYRGRPSYGWSPHIQQSFGSPETFYFYQLYVSLFGHWQFNENWGVVGDVGVNIHNNYDRFNFTVDGQPSPLPRVRTLVREYMLQDVWLNRIQLNYFQQLNNDWYALAYGGVLERMYSGVGGEVLYRPLDSTWAFGLDVNRVRQRDFSGAFGLRDYEVTTGHFSVYYDIGRDFSFLEDSLLTLNFGQFLAGDRGVNITYQRRFDSSLTVGAYAAFTNVSSRDYGEGSFTKGFFISIPFDLFSVRPTRTRGTFGWTPIYRDGGHMLNRRMQLHSITENRAPFYNR